MKNFGRIFKPVALVLIALATLTTLTVNAERDDRQHRDKHNTRVEAPPKDYRLDNRYQHDRYYPRRGHIERALPQRHYIAHYHDRAYFYFRGIWYRPSGPRFIVVAPPIGIIVPFLPPFYTTIWVSGIPYYYANETYYIWRPDLNGYEVTDLPSPTANQEPELMADQLYIYPAKGQSDQQLADDRYECYRWSVEQTGYDPTAPPENLPQNVLNTKREDYRRAMKTCLDGRGYSVR